MPALRDDIDPDGLLEYSVVFSDRSLNSMSGAFGEVMRDISRIMRNAYGAGVDCRCTRRGHLWNGSHRPAVRQ